MIPFKKYPHVLQEDGFTLVSSPKKSAVLHSALFKFIQNLSLEELQQYTETGVVVGPTEERHAFLLKLKPNAKSALEGYEVFDRHIRIDETFGEACSKQAKIKLFTHWHYTEKLVNKNNEQIKIHAYFHYNSMLTIYQILPNAKKIELTDPQISKIIYNNTHSARLIISLLLNKLNDYHKQMEIKFNLSFAKLHNIQYMAKLSAEDITQEFEECQQNYQLLQACNDTPNKTLELSLDKLKIAIYDARKSLLPQEPPTPANPLIIKPSQTKPTSTQVKLITRTEEIAQFKLKIIRLEKDYKKFSIDELIQLEDHKILLEDELLEEFFKINSTQQNATLEELNERLKKLPTLVQNFIDNAFNANISNVKKLYKHAQDKLPHSFYQDFFEHISQNTLSAQNDENLAQIYGFLYEVDSKCRLFVSTLPCTFKFYPQTPHIEYSALFLLAIHEKITLFKFLISKLQYENYPGVLVGDNSYSLLQCLAFTCEDHRYLECLIEHDALIEGFEIDLTTNQSSPLATIFKQEHVKNKVNHSQVLASIDPATSPSELEFIENFINFMPAKSALFSYCMNNVINDQIILHFIEHSSTLNISLSFAALILQFKAIRLPGNDSSCQGIYHICHDNKVNNLVKQINNQPNAATHLKFILLAKLELLAPFRIILTALDRQLVALNPAQIDELIITLAQLAINTKNQGNYSLALIAHNAILITLNHQPPNPNTHTRIVKSLNTLSTLHSKDQTSMMKNQNLAFSNIFKELANKFQEKSIFKTSIQDNQAAQSPKPCLTYKN